jgi:hypothetical protein
VELLFDAEKSDLFDVLAHVAYVNPAVTREVRGDGATVAIDSSSTRSSELSATLGEPEQIGQVFARFQKFLYEPRANA